MIYIKPDGSRLTLSGHTPQEWADELVERFVRLGVSKEAALRLTADIRNAKPW